MVLLIVLFLVIGIGVVLVRMLLSPKEGSAAASPTETELPLPQVTTSLQTPSAVVTGRPDKEDPESILYQYLYEQVDGQQQVVNFTAEDMSMEQIGQVLEQLQRQPEFFWLEGYELIGSGTEYQVEFDWKYTDLTARRSGIDELCLAFLYQIHRRFYMPHKDFALRCQLDFFCAPYEKCLIQFSLQCFDGLAYSRLGNEELLGGLGKIQS